ncbi:TVP38/TMEM64 family protein [Lunatimonas salinarum]|uniref:TVP38/TMEM64 family protein n=1 Tax=Lunatimonas salinarum TaxID=1774590 RepID=UPI001FD7589A|nr:VTT domain-containing protein [Lunatimonas salinarum]
MRDISRSNPQFFWALTWVAVMPSMGSMASIRYLMVYEERWPLPMLDSPLAVSLFIIASALSMGLALIPTTFLAIISGYIWGWEAFAYLVVAYTIATAIGYRAGRSVSAEMLDPLLDQYPKVGKIIQAKQQQIGSLIFFIRISPAIPFAFSNILFSLLSTGMVRVLWFGLWGMLPRTTLAFSSGVFAESMYDALKDNSRSSTDVVLFITFLLISIAGIGHFFRQKT